MRPTVLPLHDLNPTGELCAGCGKPAAGYAFVGDQRYCHEGESPTCYETAPATISIPLDDISEDLLRDLLALFLDKEEQEDS